MMECEHGKAHEARTQQGPQQLNDISDTFAVWPPELVAAYLHNRPLTETQTHEIKRLRSQAEADLPEITRIIAEIEVKIQELQKRREWAIHNSAAITATLEFCARLDAPTRRLPFDILQEIAAYSHPMLPAPTFDRFNSPFSAVCSTWRDAFLSSPHLWTTLYIRIGTRESLNADRVSAWLKRASGLPLTLYLDFIRDCHGVPVARIKDITQFLKAISPSIQHLSHLGIRARSLDALQTLFPEPLPWDVSELQQLDIRTHFLGGLKLSTHLDASLLFANPPAFSTLTIASLIDSSQTGSAAFPERWPLSWVSPKILYFSPQWSKLTCIRLSAPLDISDWISTMTLAVALETASVELTIREPIITTLPPPSPAHSSLEHLSLTLDGTFSNITLHEVMHAFRLPKLKTLRLLRDDSEDDLSYTEDVINSEVPHVAESSDKSHELEELQSLAIHCSFNEDLRPLLRKMRNLHTLSIHMQNQFTYNLITNLSHHGEDHVCPHLTTLRIVCHEELGFVETASLLNLLRSAQPINGSLPCGCQPLQSVFLNIGTDSAVQELKKYIAAFKLNGLDVRLSYDWTARYDSVPHIPTFDDIYLC